MSLPLEGIKVLDLTGVQAGPECTQMLAWFGADVVKVEAVGVGDNARKQFCDIPDVDALHFTMQNSNKKSLELNILAPEGKEIFEKLVRTVDVIVEEDGPTTLADLGFAWNTLRAINPRLVFGSIDCGGEHPDYAGMQLDENIAQCIGGVASTTGFWEGPPTLTSASVGGSNAGMHLLMGILAALLDVNKTGQGQRVSVSMQDAALNLCRVKLRDQQRINNGSPLTEYPQYPDGPFNDTVPRGGNASGGGQPGWVLKCKGSETDANAYLYLVIQAHNWANTCEAIGKPEWIEDPEYSTVEARQPHMFQIFSEIESWLADKTKYAAVEIFRQFNVPSFPVLSMKEIEDDEDLRVERTIVEVEHKGRGTYLTVGCPFKFSNFTPEIKAAPLLGEHTNEILADLGYSSERIASFHEHQVVGSTAIQKV